jgi:hypothetical protein
MLSIGNRDLLSGPCHWIVNVHGNSQQYLDEGNLIGFNWSAWHDVTMMIDRRTSTFTFDIDSTNVYEGEFTPFSGDSFAVEWG